MDFIATTGCWPTISELVKPKGLNACGIRNGETVVASIIMQTYTTMVILWFAVHETLEGLFNPKWYLEPHI